MTRDQLTVFVAAVLHAGRRLEREMSGTNYGEDAQDKAPSFDDSIARAAELVERALQQGFNVDGIG